MRRRAAPLIASIPGVLSLAETLYTGLGVRYISALLSRCRTLCSGLTWTHTWRSVVFSGCLRRSASFLLLRVVGIERRHAAALAALALVFPWSDSVRLWPTATNLEDDTRDYHRSAGPHQVIRVWRSGARGSGRAGLSETWDVRGAVRPIYNENSLAAYSIGCGYFRTTCQESLRYRRCWSCWMWNSQ
jgi:hypothetical protein